jgi:putative membrane protein
MATAQTNSDEEDAVMYWSNHMSAGGWILSVLWTLIIIALVVAGVVWLISAASNREPQQPASNARAGSAREILDRRLANGELTVEQYKQLRETISDPAPATPDTGSRRPAGAPG